MNLKSMAISVVMLGFVLLGFPSSGWALYGSSFWEFTTDTEYFSGDYVDVFPGSPNETINLDTSSTQEVPGVVVFLDDPIRSLWGSPVPGNVGVTSMTAFKTLDDSWFLSTSSISVISLDGYYFSATMSGVAMRYNPITFLTFENFTLNIAGWMHYEYSGEELSIDGSECNQQCLTSYLACSVLCSTWQCYDACMDVFLDCLKDCRSN